MKVFDLFCGTKSIANTAESLGHDTFTLDSDPIHEPDICSGILSFREYEIPFTPDVVWASPPCTTWSIASCGTHWTVDRKPKTHAAEIGVLVVKKTIALIKEWLECNPDLIWFMENPRGLLRKQDFMQDVTRHTVTYCQYGDTRMKPTDIWTNCKTWQPKPMCKNGDPCHVAAPRGSRTGTQGLKGAAARSVIPPQLCREIILACEQQLTK